MQAPTDAANTQRPYADDEIDLFELVENLWKQKVLILLVTVVVTVLGAGYAVLATPQYEAQVDLIPPAPAKIEPLTSLVLYKDITSGSILHEFLVQLNSSDLRQQFIAEATPDIKADLYGAGSATEQLSRLKKQLKITAHDEKKGDSVFTHSVTMSASSQENAASELDRLMTFTSTALVEEWQQRYSEAKEHEKTNIERKIALLEQKLKEERDAEIIRLEEAHQLRLKQLTDELSERRQVYQVRLQDRIRSLEEAHAIAESLNIVEPRSLNQATNAANNRVEIIAELRNQSDPLYLRGTRLLGAELSQLRSRPDDFFPDERIRELEAQIAHMNNNRQIEILRARKSDHPFSADIQSLKARLATLEAEQFPNNFSVQLTASPAVATAQPVKPKKMLIIALSVVLGGMAGVMIALVRTAIRSRRESQAS
jgi:LPS O-antigen subunit length determinant protein (WzzB/FepE family)